MLPLIWCDDLAAPLAWRQGRPITRRQYLADVRALAARLPADGPLLNTSSERYHFAVGLGAGLLRGHANLMPPNHLADTVVRLQALFANSYGLHDDPVRQVALPMVWQPHAPAPLPDDEAVPQIPADALAAQVLTSGSTGAPMPHAKHWGGLVQNTQAGAQRLASHMGRASLAGVAIVATVPAQHMYGFESTVLVSLLAGAAFDVERPFYPADIARALGRVPRPRLLVTTPFHLKLLLDSGVAVPPIDLTLCATAPLSPQLAARAEATLGAPLMEIYGCTEAGQVASRRPAAGIEWHTYAGLRLSGDGEASVISGGHVPVPTRLADVLEVVDAQSFRLLGRSNDLINVAGKRSSLAHLNYHLNSIAGVQDGAFWLPPGADDGTGDGTGDGSTAVLRLAAFVVAPGLAHADILAALRQRIDPAFLPRPLVSVPALPREPTGKLPASEFSAWAALRLQPGAGTAGPQR